jgi:acyl-CoA reductase-like NAD-dependent aldehyde dehydrogenase
MAINHQTIYYGGGFHKANSTAAIEIINPSTRAEIASVPDCNAFDVSEAVQSAVSALLK